MTLAFIAHELTATSGAGWVSVGLSASAGLVSGAALIPLLRVLEPRIDTTAGRWASIGFTVIVVAAVGGTLSSAVPRSIVAFVDGAVLGFFLAFDAVLVIVWRRDAAFRSRIKRAWRGQ